MSRGREQLESILKQRYRCAWGKAKDAVDHWKQ